MEKNYSILKRESALSKITKISITVFLLFFANQIFSQTITLKTASEFIIDSNNSCLPGFDGPHATYVSYEICNNTGSTLIGATATLGIVGTGFSLGGNQAPTQELGLIEDGGCSTLFWYVIYPCEPIGETADITVTLKNSLGVIIGTPNVDVVSVRSGLSAKATGLLGAQTINSNTGIGQLSSFDVEYTFGTTDDGGDISFQPVGNIDFDAECFQLIGVEILESAFSCIPVGNQQELYFQLLTGCGLKGSGNIVKARFFFTNVCLDATTRVQPYAYGLSGTQLKYTGNFEDPTSISTIPKTINNFNFSKTVSPTTILSAPGTINYTISIENTSAEPAYIDRIDDDLPSPFTFNSIHPSSDINSTNSTIIPSNGDSGTISFVGGIPSSTYPFYEYLIAGNSTINLVYIVDVPAGTLDGQYINSATYSIGGFTSDPKTALFNLGSCNLIGSGKTLETCNANGTLSDGSDDYVSFSLNPTGTNLGATYVVSVDNGGTISPSTGTYGSATAFALQSGSSDGTTYTVTITDVSDGSCSTTTTVQQSSCSTTCNLIGSGKTLETCNANGTLSDGSDDYVSFSLNPTGTNLGATYVVSVDNGGTISPSTGTYGSATAFALQSGSSDGTTYTVTITDVSDGSCSTTTTVQQSSCSILVDGNPLAVDDTASTSEDIPVATVNVLTNDTVIDGATITSFDEVSVSGGIVTNNGDGTFTYAPVIGFVGDDSFTYTLCDDDTPEASCSTATVTVTITDQGDPIVNDDLENVNEDSIDNTINWIDNDSLIDSSVLFSFDVESVNGGIISDNGDGTFSYSPAIEFSGEDSFEYTICDDDYPESTCLTASVNIIVDPKILIFDDIFEISFIEPIEIPIFENDGSIPVNSIFEINVFPIQGELSINDNGTPNDFSDDVIIYIPNANFVGEDTFSYSICDSKGNCKQAIVEIKGEGVLAECMINFPNNGNNEYDGYGFSPNGDNWNDEFKIDLIQNCYPNYQIQIFNRWGSVVFEYKHNGDPSKEPIWWDGKSQKSLKGSNNKILSAGVYFYILNLNNGNKKLITGYIYLNK